MKNIVKVLAISLLASLLGVVAVTSLFAASTPTASTQMSIDFRVPTGIRYNEGFDVFEVFNAAGVSYIASDWFVDYNGDVRPANTTGLDSTYRKATGADRYHIMQDIAYTQTDAMNPAFKVGEGAEGVRYSILSGGVLDGRGFYLKGFPIANGTSLINENSGTIRNLNIIDPTAYDVNANSSIICFDNKVGGIIEDSSVAGEITNYGASTAATFQSNATTIAYINNGRIQSCQNSLDIISLGGAGGIAFEGYVFGEIRNCVNQGIIIAVEDAGGIVATTDTLVSNCTNYGSIYSTQNAGGIVGISYVFAALSLFGNANYGDISGDLSAAGLLGGWEGYMTIVHKGNVNYGQYVSIDKDNEHEFLALDIGAIPVGIRWSVSKNAFEVYTATGVSYIGSGLYMSRAGETSVTPVDGYRLLGQTDYYIMKDIEYEETDYFNQTFKNSSVVLDEDSIIYGQGFNLIDFPITSAKGSSFIRTNNGTIKNLNMNVVYESGTYVSGLVYTNSATGTIENCTISGEINEDALVRYGTFSYDNLGTIDGCANEVNVTSHGANKRFGGIAYSNAGTISNSINKGELTATADGGGRSQRLAGIASVAYASGKILKCDNVAQIWVEAVEPGYFTSLSVWERVAGIIALIDLPAGARYEIEDCSNTALVRGLGRGYIVAGLIGSIVGPSSGEKAFVYINNVNMGGRVSHTKGNWSGYGLGTSSLSSGVIGRVDGTQLELKITNSTHSSTQSSNHWIAGFVGLISGPMVSIDNCNNVGDLGTATNNGGNDGDTAGGGFVARLLSGELIIKNSTNSGTITGGNAQPDIGGFVGNTPGGRIVLINNTNTGEVSSSLSVCNVGGFIGSAWVADRDVTLFFNKNIGAVKGGSTSCGIMGGNFEYSNVKYYGNQSTVAPTGNATEKHQLWKGADIPLNDAIGAEIKPFMDLHSDIVETTAEDLNLESITSITQALAYFVDPGFSEDAMIYLVDTVAHLNALRQTWNYVYGTAEVVAEAFREDYEAELATALSMMDQGADLSGFVKADKDYYVQILQTLSNLSSAAQEFLIAEANLLQLFIDKLNAYFLPFDQADADQFKTAHETVLSKAEQAISGNLEGLTTEDRSNFIATLEDLRELHVDVQALLSQEVTMLETLIEQLNEAFADEDAQGFKTMYAGKIDEAKTTSDVSQYTKVQRAEFVAILGELFELSENAQELLTEEKDALQTFLQLLNQHFATIDEGIAETFRLTYADELQAAIEAIEDETYTGLDGKSKEDFQSILEALQALDPDVQELLLEEADWLAQLIANWDNIVAS